jgi:hypothetical protein
MGYNAGIRGGAGPPEFGDLQELRRKGFTVGSIAAGKETTA